MLHVWYIYLHLLFTIKIDQTSPMDPIYGIWKLIGKYIQTVDLNMEAWNLFEISQMRAVWDGENIHFPFKGCLNDSGWRIIPGVG